MVIRISEIKVALIRKIKIRAHIYGKLNDVNSAVEIKKKYSSSGLTVTGLARVFCIPCTVTNVYRRLGKCPASVRK
jgi:hypothetical protein